MSDTVGAFFLHRPDGSPARMSDQPRYLGRIVVTAYLPDGTLAETVTLTGERLQAAVDVGRGLRGMGDVELTVRHVEHVDVQIPEP